MVLAACSCSEAVQGIKTFVREAPLLKIYDVNREVKNFYKRDPSSLSRLGASLGGPVGFA